MKMLKNFRQYRQDRRDIKRILAQENHSFW